LKKVKGRKLTVVGESTTGGGSFKKVRMMGKCRIDGDLKAETCKIGGECLVDGNMDCGYFSNLGEVTVLHLLQANEMRLIGITKVKQQCAASQLVIYGRLLCERDFFGQEAKVHGLLHVRGNVSLTQMEMTGGIFVGGLLRCRSILIALKIDADNYVREIHSNQITVKKKRALFHQGPIVNFQADLIAGGDIDLEYTTARVVRGNHVTIGPGCKIDRIEYSDNYSSSRHTEVGRAIRVCSDRA
jgi:cytoskeletal protein CcmA (bactofilin family)